MNVIFKKRFVKGSFFDFEYKKYENTEWVMLLAEKSPNTTVGANCVRPRETAGPPTDNQKLIRRKQIDGAESKAFK